MKYLYSISFGLHDIDIDADDFYKRGSFKLLSVDGYERSLSFLSEACNGINSVDGSMKLHAVFPSTANKLRVSNTSYFCQNCFEISFKPETACSG